ncbi:hypothetical protein BY458DRAFT_518499 [Sporodiniella umbellata]|nr:hypothetical protein BY458DRAFT_518499 [Sporodiniella umbellata]
MYIWLHVVFLVTISSKDSFPNYKFGFEVLCLLAWACFYLDLIGAKIFLHSRI